MRAADETTTDDPRRGCGGLGIGRVLALALALRVLLPAAGWLFATPAPLVREPDSASYVRAAEGLVHSASFGRPGEPELVRTPGYPLLLMPGVWLQRVDLVTIAVQIGLGSLTTFLVYRLGLSIFERHDAAVAGALLYACEPVSALYCSKLLSETLFTAALTLSLWRLACWLRRPSWQALVLAAAALACAIYVRPIAYVLPCIVACTLVVACWKKTPSRRGLLIRAGAFFLASMAPVWAWQARNAVVAGYPHFSAISDVNLYYYQAAALLAERERVSLHVMQQELGYFDENIYFQRHPEQRSWSQAERYAYLRREGRRIVSEHPAAMLRIQLQGAAALLVDPGVSAYLGFFRLDKAHTEAAPNKAKTKQAEAAKEGTAAPRSLFGRFRRALAEKPLALAVYGALSLTWLIYFALAARGLLLGAVWSSPAGRLLLTTTATLILLSGGPVGYHRLRLPVMPEFCLLAGGAAASLRGMWAGSKVRKKPAARQSG